MGVGWREEGGPGIEAERREKDASHGDETSKERGENRRKTFVQRH